MSTSALLRFDSGPILDSSPRKSSSCQTAQTDLGTSNERDWRQSQRGEFTLSTDLEISTEPGRLDIRLIHEFLSRSYWAQGRPRSVVEESIENSLCFGVYLDMMAVTAQ